MSTSARSTDTSDLQRENISVASSSAIPPFEPRPSTLFRLSQHRNASCMLFTLDMSRFEKSTLSSLHSCQKMQPRSDPALTPFSNLAETISSL